MKRDDLRYNRKFILRELQDLYFDVNERMNEHYSDLSNNKMHSDIYDYIWLSLTEPTNIKMLEINIMIGLLDTINIKLVQLAMLNDCCYSEFVERLKQIKLFCYEQSDN